MPRRSTSESDPIRARLHARWAEDGNLRDVFGSYAPTPGYRWRNLELTLDDDYDVLVVFEHARVEDVDPARTVVFQSEPAPSRRGHRELLGHAPEAFRAFYDVERHHSVNIWHVGRFQVETVPEKTRLLSAVVSSTSSLPRHAERLAFVTRHLATLPGFDHFGRGAFSGPSYRGAVAMKADALLPYRYTFNAENWLEPNYFTEKILDAILCETLCFYDGCPNLELFLDPETFVRVEVGHPEEALATVEEAIARDEWSRRIDAIRAQKRRLLDELNPLEVVRKVLSGEPIVWRPERRPLADVDADAVHVVDPQAPDAHRAALERIAAGAGRVGIVLDAHSHLTDGAAALVDAHARAVRPGDLVLLGGVGIEPFRHLGARPLVAGRELRHVAKTGDEKPVAYAATPDAARALLRSPVLRPGGVRLLGVWPQAAFVPGPLMRRDGGLGDVPLLTPSRRSSLHRVAGAVVPALPRGRRLATVALEAVSLAGVEARHLLTPRLRRRSPLA